MLNSLKPHITHQEQMSEALILSLFLAFSGGFQDAYTYIQRNAVFANAQTGNIVLMSTYLIQRNWNKAIHYLFPLLAFMLGIFIADSIQYHFKNASILHWRQGILVLEVAILFLVGFMPQELNLPANCLVSFSCALQVQSFRKVSGNAYASTMCIGNLRSCVSAVSSYVHEKKRKSLKKALYYFSVIFVFAIGAGIGGNLSIIFETHTIWISCLILIFCCFIMELDRKPVKK